MSKELKTELIERCLVITFTRPEIRNPLSVTVLEQLHHILDGVAVDNGVDAVIFTGQDASFASGADLREIAGVDAASAPAFALRGQGLMNKVAELRQHTTAAVNGYCFGGALDLALACSRRIASPDAKFAHPGAGLGIITGWGGTQRLPRLVGRGRALELFFTAEPVNADKALSWGLIDEIADEPVAAALKNKDNTL